MRLFSNSSTRTPRRAGLRALLLGLALQALAGVAAAQDVLTLENAADFEGNSGIKFISVPLT